MRLPVRMSPREFEVLRPDGWQDDGYETSSAFERYIAIPGTDFWYYAVWKTHGEYELAGIHASPGIYYNGIPAIANDGSGQWRRFKSLAGAHEAYCDEAARFGSPLPPRFFRW